MRTRPARLLASALLLLCLSIAPSSGQTLKDLLQANAVPLDRFSPAELREAVQGTAASRGRQTMLAYQVGHAGSSNPDGGYTLDPPLHLLSFNRSTRNLRRSTLVPHGGELCPGRVEALSFIGSFSLLSTDLNPSSQCLLVLGADLRLHHTLYGFDPHQVIPNHVTIIENLIHFAPSAPERLQLVDLQSGKTTELYPPLHDPLRAHLIREHARNMPPPDTCKRLNDPCNPTLFDETISALNTDGHGRFAFLSVQTANHATEPGVPPESVADQAVLYLYRHLSTGWRYCELPIDEANIEATRDLLRSSFPEVARRCRPDKLVCPDMSTASNNPFMHR